MGPGVESIYGEDVGISCGDTVVRPPSTPDYAGHNDNIAPISENRLNFQRLREIDTHGELQGVLEAITDVQAFQSLFHEAGAEKIREWREFPVSHYILQHLQALEGYGVLKRREGRENPKCVMPAYTVTKKSGGLRFICDARLLNECMQRPPEMRLSHITDLVRRVKEASWVYLADARSWFYQFELAEDIRPYFAVFVGGQRGDFIKTHLAVMCMGWSHAPAIAHRAARALLPPEAGETWIDNFVIVGTTREEATAKYRSFQEKCTYVGVELNQDDPQMGVPLQQFDTFGIQFDLRSHRHRMTEKWVTKVIERDEVQDIRGGQVTPRRFYKVFGSLVWHGYVMSIPLCYMPASLSFIRRIARDAKRCASEWDIPRPVPAAVIQEIVRRLQTLHNNDWRGRDPTRRVTVWSDASSEEWAAKLTIYGRTIVSQGTFSDADRPKHIYLKELGAALQAIRLASAHVQAAVLVTKIDNKAAMFSTAKGHSANYAGNIILQQMHGTAAAHGTVLAPEWVPTDQQEADCYTRGVKATYNYPLPTLTL